MKVIFHRLYVLFLLPLIISTSCEERPLGSKISSSGKTCEMIVVMNDVHWEALPGDTVRSVFEAFQPGLPQDEPWMDIVHMSVAGFSDIFQKHRVIFFFEVDPDMVSAKTIARKDVWSQPQIVVQIKAPNPEMLANEFGSKAGQLFELVREAEHSRLIKAYQNAPAKIAENKVAKLFNINLNIPYGYQIVLEKSDFVWMKRDAGKYEQGIFIYSRPYKDTEQFDDMWLLKLRDTVTARYVPGPLEGKSHMGVEWLFPPGGRDVRLNGNYAREMRGEWMVTDDKMGGPFIQYAFVDTLRNRLICLDGYVYNPGGEKRDALIHVEGVFHSVKIRQE
jgi:hypothetical protein